MSETKYINLDNVKTIWDAAKNKFVAQEDGKGLSSNDYTDSEKTKLATRVTAFRNASGALVLTYDNPPEE